MRRSIKILGGIVVLFLLLVIVSAAMGGNNSSTSTATATPVATAQSNAKATATPQATAAPTATPTAAPTGGVGVDALNNGMTSLGYTVTQPFAANGTTPEGYQMYTGQFTKDGISYAAILVQTDSSASAQAYLPTAIGHAQDAGFSGSQSGSTWTGSNSDGVQAMVGVINSDQVLILLGE